MYKHLGAVNGNQISSIIRNTPFYLKGVNVREDCYILDYFGYDKADKISLVLIENPKNSIPIMVAVTNSKII